MFVYYAQTSKHNEEEIEKFYMELKKFYKEDHTFYKSLLVILTLRSDWEDHLKNSTSGFMA